MDEPSLVFPVLEYKRRIAALQDLMAADSIDALLLTTAADVFYVTGFLTRFWESPARPWFVVVPAVGDPVAVIPSIGTELMQKTWVRTIRTWDAPDPRDDGIGLLGSIVGDLTPPTGRVGLPMGLETQLRMPLADYAKLKTRLLPRAFVDATAIVQRVREVKSDAEVAKIRECCDLADRAFGQINAFAKAGAPLAEVFRSFQIELLAAGADWVSYVAGGAGQGGYGDVISPAGDQRLSKGDVLMLDTGAVRDGYFCDYNRNFSVGPPPSDTMRVHEALWDATETALMTVRPGWTAADVHAAIDQALRKHGVTPCAGRFGHGLGITLTEWPSFTPLDTTELREGMVLTLEPSAVVSDSHLLVHEENLVLRSSGPELLSVRAPRILPELTV